MTKKQHFINYVFSWLQLLHFLTCCVPVLFFCCFHRPVEINEIAKIRACLLSDLAAWIPHSRPLALLLQHEPARRLLIALKLNAKSIQQELCLKYRGIFVYSIFLISIVPDQATKMFLSNNSQPCLGRVTLTFCKSKANKPVALISKLNLNFRVLVFVGGKPEKNP